MPHYDTIQIGKTISSYGGVDSLIQTKDHGSILIRPYDEWPVYTNCVLRFEVTNPNANDKTMMAKVNQVDDPRLIRLLQNMHGFINLKMIFVPPLNERQEGIWWNVEDGDKLMSARYFPEWFYCPKCRTLKHLNTWNANWNQQGFTRPQPPHNPDLFDDKFPRCFLCRIRAVENNWRKKNFDLEQVRFVLASEATGDMIDIPWGQLIGHPYLDDKKAIIIADNPNDSNLKYGTSGSTANLYGLTIRSDNQRRSLGDIFSIKFIKDGIIDYQAVVRGGSNLYFAVTISSIYIPTYAKETYDKVRNAEIAVRTIIPNIRYPEIILAVYNILQQQRVALEQGVVEYLLKPYENIADYREQEFRYFTTVNNISHHDLVLSQPDWQPDNNLSFISRIYSLKKLKETAVQTGYKRISKENGRENFTSTAHEKADVKYIPGVSSYGEGIFFVFDMDKFQNTINAHKETILVTFSNIVMKELEFECGYALTSLKQRLYKIIDKNQIITALGVLIYSINGSDGSYGGLTSLVPDGIHRIVVNALERAKDCPHDPICESEGGHCFACTELPETSVDWEYGSNLTPNRNILNNFIATLGA